MGDHIRKCDSRGGAHLQEQLWSLKYQPGMTGGMAAHVSKVCSLVTRMRNISGKNEPSDDNVVAVLRILKSVRRVASFKPLCKVLRNKPDCSLEDVANQLEDQERENLLDEEEEVNVAMENVSIGPKTKLKPRSTTLHS